MKPKHKVEVIDTRPYQLQRELQAIKDEMARAMQDAHVPYVAQGRMTDHMQRVLRMYYDWAQRYVRNQQ